MLPRIRRKKQYKFSICILYPVCSLQSTFCTRSAVCIFHWPNLYCWFCSSEPQVRTEILELEKNFSQINSAAMIDVWTVCWRAPLDKQNDRAMITLNQLKTNANARLTNKAASDALLRGHNVCWNETAAGPLGVNISASRFNLHL